jgi:hypothetical protein
MSRLVIPKLAFLFHIPDVYYHYRPVLDLLNQESFDIVLPDDPPPVLLELMEARQYRYSFISDLLAAKTMYKYLVSDHLFLHDYKLLQEIGTRQIRFFSELGYDRLQLGNYNRLYDMVLCFGRYQELKLAFCSKGTKFFQVGWPRYDAWFQELTLDREALLDDLNCDRYRPVLVWLPTFGDLSSIDYYAETIGQLADRYNIIIKPHDYTLLEEFDRLEVMKRLKIQSLISTPFDEMLLYFIADCVLADYGSTPFGSLYCDKRMVLLDVPDAYNHEFTGMGSSDIVMRNHYPSVDPNDNPDTLIRLIEGETYNVDNVRLNRLRDRLFAPYYGRAAQEAATILGAIDQFL